MLKKILSFIAFFILALTVWFQSEDFLLQFYVFFPTLVLAIVFFVEDDYRPLLPFSFLLLLAIYTAYLIKSPSWEMLLLGVGGIVFTGGICLFRFRWQKDLGREARDCETIFRDLEVLKQKHQSRLESLHHLEKQVSGLLDLFEVVRDFNDYLDFEGMASILHQRVLPEFPFKSLKLVIQEKLSEGLVYRSFVISAGGVETFTETGEMESSQEKEWLEQLKATRKLIQQGQVLVFPLITDGDVTAFLRLDESHPDDLPKFEVLAAYLALQVRKVRLYQTVRDLAIRDGLTGLLVRRHFLERFEEEIRRSMHYNLPLAVLVLDIDHFKRYNDEYGHLAGDATLKQVAMLLRENLRKVDLVSRYGGEEFAVVIPETRKATALEIGERIRSSIARHNFKVYNDQTRVTVSIGIALFPEAAEGGGTEPREPGPVVTQLIQKADEALYQAKDEGRNRVILHQDL